MLKIGDTVKIAGCYDHSLDGKIGKIVFIFRGKWFPYLVEIDGETYRLDDSELIYQG